MQLLKLTLLPLFVSLLVVPSVVRAHDTWVEAGRLAVERGEYVYVDLRLGNHGNEHRDFKLASKVTLAPCTLSATSPGGKSIDLKPAIIDMGYAEKEGYWSARFVPEEAGVYEFVHTLDILHGTVRAIKSAKTYLIATDGDASGAAPANAFPKCHGHGLELSLESDLTSLAAGNEVALIVTRGGKPLADARVAFIPRGATLQAGFDPEYERTSDAQGRVAFTPARGEIVLAVAHYVAADEQGAGYERTHYAATLVLPIPNKALK